MPDFKDYNHNLIQLIDLDMKKFFALSAIVLLFAFVACTPENSNNGKNGGNQNDPEELTITGEALDVTDYSTTLTGFANLPLEFGDAEVGILYDKSQSFEDAKKVIATSLDGNNKFTVTATGLKPSTTYYYKSYVQNGMAVKYGAVKSFTTKESTIPAGAVDLGIVMTREDGTTYNLYWAKSNLCESGLCANPEDYGDYYAWGETVPYYIEGHRQDNPCSSWRSRTDHPITGYNWVSYKFRTSGGDNDNNVTFSKYNTKESYGHVDNITELQRDEKEGETMDDAASSKLGGRWRMPTDAEWTELMKKCTWTWTDDYNGTGVAGRIVTSNVDGYKDKSIFLPAAGDRYVAGLYKTGSYGFYWSSSLSTDVPSYARRVYFFSGGVYKIGEDRYRGFSVRPVSE